MSPNGLFYVGILFLELIILIFLNFYLISLFISHFKGAPFVPTGKKKIDKILSLLRPRKGRCFYDLGCGDGRVVKKAAEKFNLTGIGVDINPFLILTLKLESFCFKRNNPQYIYKDIFKINLKKADYIYCFLMPPLLEKLRVKFDRELKKNTIVISHGFKIPNWNKNLFYTLYDKPFNTYFYKIN